MTLRWLLYVSESGAKYNTYPNGPGSTPVLVAYTEQERAEWAQERDRVLKEWESTDPDGFHSWKVATAAMVGGDDSALSEGWSAKTLADDGMRIVDPCAHCRECRSRR
jgi:hypothetical protein